ncbi:hypothetical protein GI582_18235 [Sulfitobacter sp. BDSS02]|nr:hypothetical protein [Sulfitobacter sp. BDSS02]MBR9852069.1 hypothetical protein [Paracoccaceae bacterium]
MAEAKDWWDKLEIIGKVALPVVIAAATIWFNSQVSERQQNADMVSIAVEVLSQATEQNDPLRDWAVDILVIQGNLASEAAAELKNDPSRVIAAPGRTAATSYEALVCLDKLEDQESTPTLQEDFLRCMLRELTFGLFPFNTLGPAVKD